MSLRILHVTPYFSEAWAYGGIPRVAAAQVRALTRLGHHVTVATTDARDADRRVPVEWRAADADVHVFRNVSNRLAFRWQCYLPRGLGRFLERAVPGFDVVHIHAHRHVLQTRAAAACRRAKVPYVLAPNGTAPRLERRLALKRVWDLLWGDAVLRDAAAVVAVSPSERRQLTALGVPAERVVEVPNPIDLGEYAVPFAPPGATGGEPVIAYLGKVTPRKRLDVVVAAFARVAARNARLVVAGSDMGGLAAALRLATLLGLGDRIALRGTLEGRARLEWLAAADVVVYPSTDEAFGLVPAEALLCGTPVVVADAGGCAEMVGSMAGAQTVPAGDADSLASAIDRVLRDRVSWRSAAAEGAAAVRARYASDVVAARLDALYRTVLAH
jgi:glycosyltransferase involved in cell wall biosynthesis